MCERDIGYYKVLSKPAVGCAPHYKGLFRFEAFPWSNEENRFMSLWQRYTENADKSPGVTTDLTLTELKELADLATKGTGNFHEAVYFSETFECPHPSDYYGADVTNLGGYSIGGENFFRDSEEHPKCVFHFFPDAVNRHFKAKLNSYGLFHALEDAISFRATVNDLVEDEEWRVFHVFKVK